MGQGFNLIGNGAATTTRVVGTGISYLSANRAARAERRNAGEGLTYAAGREARAIGMLDPYAEAGENALTPLTGLLTGQQYNASTGQSTPISQEARDNLMYQSPGYRFAVQQGQQGLDRSQAARGLLLSGGAQKELAGYLSGMASQYSDNYINQLTQLAGMGRQAATSQAAILSGNTPGFTDLYRGSMNSAYQAQKWHNFDVATQQSAEAQAQSHEKAGQSLSSMFGGNIMGGAGNQVGMGGGGGGGGMMGG